MLKKRIQYNGFDGDTFEEDFYFHLSKAEMAEMALGHQDFAGYLRQIVAANDGATIMAEFKKIIAATVGKKAPDGKQFIKNKDITDAFMQSDAFSVLFMELVTNATAASEFVNGVVPADMRGEIAAATDIPFPGLEGSGVKIVQVAQEAEKAPEDYTIEELVAMDEEAFRAVKKSLKGKNVPMNVLLAGFQRNAE